MLLPKLTSILDARTQMTQMAKTSRTEIEVHGPDHGRVLPGGYGGNFSANTDTRFRMHTHDTASAGATSPVVLLAATVRRVRLFYQYEPEVPPPATAAAAKSI